MAFEPSVERWRPAVSALWPAGEVDNTLGVMSCESHGDPNAHATEGEDSRGLMQINVGPGAHTDLAGLDLYDPGTNLRAAFQIWQESGWGPWSCARAMGITGGSSGGEDAGGGLALAMAGFIFLFLVTR